MEYKYIVLDFGNVIALPTTGNWHVTPKFLELIDMNEVDVDSLKIAIKKNGDILSEKIITLDEEYDMFQRFYDHILRDIHYSGYDEKIIQEIAYDRTYRNDKYRLCDNIVEELSRLKDKYTLIMLTDNWPSVIPYLKDNHLYDYFDKIYISSIYCALKRDGIFFDYPIHDFHIKEGEALFIDDDELNLDVARDKGFDVMLMDRYKGKVKSKHRVIHDLMDI